MAIKKTKKFEHQVPVIVQRTNQLTITDLNLFPFNTLSSQTNLPNAHCS